MTSALQDCASTATKRREGGRLRAIGAGLLLAAALLPAAGAGAQPTRRHEVWHLHWRAVAERGGGRCLLRHSLCGIAGGRSSLPLRRRFGTLPADWAPTLRNRCFTDSAQERNGFEPSVPR